jgi:hypothetical protein
MGAHIRAIIRGRRVKLAPHLQQLALAFPRRENKLRHFRTSLKLEMLAIRLQESPCCGVREKDFRVIVDPFGWFLRGAKLRGQSGWDFVDLYIWKLTDRSKIQTIKLI